MPLTWRRGIVLSNGADISVEKLYLAGPILEVIKETTLFSIRWISILAAAGLGLIVAASLLSFAGDDQVRKELEAIYAQIDRSFKDKDFAYVKSLKTPDYTEKTKEGRVRDREESDAKGDLAFQNLSEVKSYSTTINSVEQGKSGNQVIVATSETGAFLFKEAGGEEHEIEIESKQRDIWLRTDAGWRLQYHEELESSTKLDGRPVD
jgi:hypothetical protein